MREMILDKEEMSQYVEDINSKTEDSEIFLMIRNIESSALSQKVKITNIADFYWFMINYRNDLKEKENG